MHATSGRDVDGSRRLTVGASGAGDSRRAGADAARAAGADGDAALLVVFCSALHDPEAVLAGVGSVAAGTPLIGCSTTAAIAAGHSPGESGVVVVAFGGPGFSVTTGISRDVDGRQRDAGIEVASCVTGLADRPHQALVVLRVFFEIHPPTVPYRSPGFRFPATDSDHMARPACDSWCGETAEARV